MTAEYGCVIETGGYVDRQNALWDRDGFPNMFKNTHVILLAITKYIPIAVG